MIDPHQSADSWTEAVARLPLAFAQVREDPRLDLELVQALSPGATVVMIASGGETAACLARTGIGRLYLVDANPAQLAITQLKLHLAGHCPAIESMRLLGHLPLAGSERKKRLLEWLDKLALAPDVFGPIEWVAEVGPAHAGRYEVLFVQLADALAPHRAQLRQILELSDPAEQIRRLESARALNDAFDQAFDRVMSLANLVRLFGSEATQNPQQPFSRHFAERTRDVLGNLPAGSNPFLWQMLTGRFPKDHCYDWLSGNDRSPSPKHQEPIYLRAMMQEALDGLNPGSCQLVHLSNILDWLKPEEALATLQSVHRVLVRGGKTIIRQLNSSLDLQGIPSGFRWDPVHGGKLLRVDRSFFYKSIHIGHKP